MVDALARNWKLVALRGVLALLFGLLTFFNPALTLISLVYLFGAYALVDGIMAIATAITNRKGESSWIALLLGGIAGVLVGIATFFMPGVTAIVLLLLIATWCIVTGVAEIVAAIQLRKVITGEWLLVLAGILSVLVGVFLVARPAVGALAVTVYIGAYAIALGVVLLMLAFRLRSWGRRNDAGARPATATP
jgi:uncharacterized membrane protein HdeD (DUF308 family)